MIFENVHDFVEKNWRQYEVQGKEKNGAHFLRLCVRVLHMHSLYLYHSFWSWEVEGLAPLKVTKHWALGSRFKPECELRPQPSLGKSIHSHALFL